MLRLLLIFLVFVSVKGLYTDELVIYADDSSSENNTIVDTTIGLIRSAGQKRVKVSQSTKIIELYYGIPYAEKPMGKNRFKKPIPKYFINGTYDANKLPPNCMQESSLDFGLNVTYTLNISEDCLYLNAYVPASAASAAENPKLPVMVWIHGGGFVMGSTEFTPLEYMAGHQNVILFQMHYRLGVLGFLTTDPKVMKGNLGLLDQQLALKWIKENAANFGGDPDRITIFGESAGAASVSFHLLNDESKDCFKRAIMQSGTAFSSWAIVKDVEYLRSQNIKFAADQLGCSNCKENKFEECLQCLQKIDARTIIERQTNQTTVLDTLTFSPVVDGDFVKEFPGNMTKDKFGNNRTEVMMGVNENEGGMMLFMYYKGRNLNDTEVAEPPISITKAAIKKYLRHWPRYPTKTTPELQNSFILQMTPWSYPTDKQKNAEAAGKFLGQAWFVSPTNILADLYVENESKVYYYLFTHRVSRSPWPTWAGSTHADEINFALGIIFSDTAINYTQPEQELSRVMMRQWANFASSGNPNHGNHPAYKDDWPVMTSSDKKYFVLDGEKSKQKAVAGGVERQQCAFFERIIPIIKQLETPATTTSRPDVTTTTAKQTEKSCPTLSQTATIIVGVLAGVLGMVLILLVVICIKSKSKSSSGEIFPMS